MVYVAKSDDEWVSNKKEVKQILADVIQELSLCEPLPNPDLPELEFHTSTHKPSVGGILLFLRARIICDDEM